MKLILAIVKPFKVTEILDAVGRDATFPGMTVCDVRGFGREKTEPGEHTRQEDLRDFTEHCLLIVGSPEVLVEQVMEKIRSVAHTGTAGDGKIFVLDLEEAVRIATGERGTSALT
jgi:nitrogen regulatory protein PII